MASAGARETGLLMSLRKSTETIARYVSACYAGGLRAFPGKYKYDFIFSTNQNLSNWQLCCFVWHKSSLGWSRCKTHPSDEEPVYRLLCTCADDPKQIKGSAGCDVSLVEIHWQGGSGGIARTYINAFNIILSFRDSLKLIFKCVITQVDDYLRPFFT